MKKKNISLNIPDIKYKKMKKKHLKDMVFARILIFDCEDQMKNNNKENSLRIPFPWSLFRQSDLAPLMETEAGSADNNDDDDEYEDNNEEEDMQELFNDVHYGFVSESIGKQSPKWIYKLSLLKVHEKK